MPPRGTASWGNASSILQRPRGSDPGADGGQTLGLLHQGEGAQPDPPPGVHRPGGDPPIPAGPVPRGHRRAGRRHAALLTHSRSGCLRHQDGATQPGPDGSWPSTPRRALWTVCSSDLVQEVAPGAARTARNWKSTPPPPCWSPPATTRTCCAARQPGRICAGCRPSRPLRARSPACGSTAAATANANSALWGVVITGLRSDPRTQAYMARRLEEGRSKPEIIRVLKRYVAREVYKQLPRTSSRPRRPVWPLSRLISLRAVLITICRPAAASPPSPSASTTRAAVLVRACAFPAEWLIPVSSAPWPPTPLPKGNPPHALPVPRGPHP